MTALLLVLSGPGVSRTAVVKCGGKKATKVGTKGPNRINGTAGNDVIAGLGGKDTIDGKGGNDRICGGAGNDTLLGGEGNDRLDGGAGNDLIDPGPGKDVAKGGAGNDELGGDSDDTLDGGGGRDKCFGGGGARPARAGWPPAAASGEAEECEDPLPAPMVVTPIVATFEAPVTTYEVEMVDPLAGKLAFAWVKLPRKGQKRDCGEFTFQANVARWSHPDEGFQPPPAKPCPDEEVHPAGIQVCATNASRWGAFQRYEGGSAAGNASGDGVVFFQDPKLRLLAECREL